LREAFDGRGVLHRVRWTAAKIHVVKTKLVLFVATNVRRERKRESLGIQPRVKSLRSSYTGLYSEKERERTCHSVEGRCGAKGDVGRLGQR